MKKTLLRLVLGAGLALLCTGCVIYDFDGGSSSDTSSWYFDDSTSLPSAFATADPKWTIDTSTGYSGAQSARSGSPSTYYGSSSMTLTVDGLESTSDIHFYYKISGGYSDYLEFYINGYYVGAYWGSSSYGSWMEANIYSESYSSTFNESGSNTLTWTYYHGSSTNTYDNCAWVDDIVIDG